MKQKFSSYFNPITNEEKNKIINEGTLIFDTNILLSLYSMENKEDVDEFFNIFENNQMDRKIMLAIV
ncbi:hypothetical protein MARBORIA2_11170 [Methanobrevibacter arboriphilus]|jgi:hypothetical protein|uniref:Uncharacterized protein n=1 Tax=Methanobrevibacter arboriphilus TaxID=39441 RepID=A0ACA8R611_METAZ|nr:hypothetical protein [Methanobrevibacter arboriphilus]MCC7561398.1 hypothetical protein [Methanobrevibacter arboriphilus]BBL62785.1 hypothetical protein MarbSA_18250 [Methanobrevibacter arboriphilus]GLI12027.1 hypothetical protein MARBORIA2_11170 [Methanobrevibacter arboriphilus]